MNCLAKNHQIKFLNMSEASNPIQAVQGPSKQHPWCAWISGQNFSKLSEPIKNASDAKPYELLGQKSSVYRFSVYWSRKFSFRHPNQNSVTLLVRFRHDIAFLKAEMGFWCDSRLSSMQLEHFLSGLACDFTPKTRFGALIHDERAPPYKED